MFGTLSFFYLSDKAFSKKADTERSRGVVMTSGLRMIIMDHEEFLGGDGISDFRFHISHFTSHTFKQLINTPFTFTPQP